jgi:hypothetical protein
MLSNNQSITHSMDIREKKKILVCLCVCLMLFNVALQTNKQPLHHRCGWVCACTSNQDCGVSYCNVNLRSKEECGNIFDYKYDYEKKAKTVLVNKTNNQISYIMAVLNNKEFWFIYTYITWFNPSWNLIYRFWYSIFYSNLWIASLLKIIDLTEQHINTMLRLF